jgi:membrane-associated phospholipid phosphatase
MSNPSSQIDMPSSSAEVLEENRAPSLDSSRYTFIDYATQGHLLIVGLIILFLDHGVEWWPLLIGAHGAGMLVVHGLVRLHGRWPKVRPVAFLRHFYPILFYTGFYRETGLLNHVVVDGYLDGFFASLDAALFGFQPAAMLMARLPHTLISELFYASYFSYYVMIVGVGLALYWQERGRFLHYVSVVSFVFYVCYINYIFIPVVGGRVFWSAIDGMPQEQLFDFYPLSFPASVRAGPFFHVMDFIYEHFEATGAAFPSSHVAVALVTLYFSHLYLRPVRHVHTVAVILLCISTVYCRYHFVVDVFAGMLAGLVLLWIGDRLFWRFQRRRPDPPQS